jgi:hypothetical protein
MVNFKPSNIDRGLIGFKDLTDCFRADYGISQIELHGISFDGIKSRNPLVPLIPDWDCKILPRNLMMGLFARLFGSKKKTEEPPPDPTSSDLQRVLTMLASEMGTHGTAALAAARLTAEQMQAIVAGLTQQNDELKRYAHAVMKFGELQAQQKILLADRQNAEAERTAAELNSDFSKSAGEQEARREKAKQAALKAATIELQLSLVRETKEKVRGFMPAEE